jgi:D-alanyl-D-alanine carboxypeptidase
MMRAAWLIVVAGMLAACAAPASPSATGPMASSTVAASATPEPRGPERLAADPVQERPEQPVLEAAFRTALVADHCRDQDLPAPPGTEMALTVLDRAYALPVGYEPPDLVPASTAGLTGLSGTKLVRSVLIEDLAAMADAWAERGLEISIDSAYRSYASQAATFESWVARVGIAAALERTARPGHSEHQLGTAIDVSSPGWAGRFGDWRAETAEGAWMAEHAWEFGFAMSYPPDGQPHTCFRYEPWHYRWIGREAAADHRASGAFLRQFLEKFLDA